jgi:ATP/ADP translocase
VKIREYFWSIFDIRPGEGRLIGLMALYNFLLLVTLYLLKPVRDSLFLVELGAKQLPFVFIITALVVVPISMGYSRLSNRILLSQVIYGVTSFLAANLLLIWWFIGIDSPTLYYILYIWVTIYSVLITSQFWLLANAIYTATQAKRIFSMLSLAAIAGAIAGGEITGLLVDKVGIASETLLLIGAATLLSTLFIVRKVKLMKNGKQQISDSQHEQQVYIDNRLLFKDILASRHLILITGIIALSVITTTIIDYQFKTIASNAYPTDSALTTFMGQFYGRVSVLALLLQLFLSSKFIDRRGVGGAVAILPTILLLGSVSLFIWPGLVAAVLLRGADQSLKHSVDRTGRELLFIPVDLQLKKRTKVFIDLFVDNGAQGIAGLLLIFFTLVITLSVQQLSLLVAGLLVLWITLTVWVRSSYVDEFRESLEDQVNTGTKQHNKQRYSLSELTQRLKNSDDAKVIQSLKELSNSFTAADIPIEQVVELLNHSNPRVQKNSIKLLRILNVKGYIETVANYLEDGTPDLRLEAARYIYHFYDPELYDEGSRLDVLHEGLHHEDIRIRAAALGLIAKDGGEKEKALLSTELLNETFSYQGEHQTELRFETARVLGVAYEPARRPILRKLLNDTSEKVRNAALLSAGRSGDRYFIHILLHYLDSSIYKKTAQNALSMYGKRIYGTLYDYMTDEQIDVSKQLLIPPIFNIKPGPVAARVLQLALPETNLPVHHEIVKAMSKIARDAGASLFNEQILKETIYRSTRRYAHLNTALDVLSNNGSSKTVFDVINGEITRTFESIFRLLGIIYNSNDIYNAYKGIKSNNPTLVSEGIEFLDNLIEWEIRKFLIPVIKYSVGEQIETKEIERIIFSADDAFDYLEELKHPYMRSALKSK